MPHAMASIHSRVSPPSYTHALTHQHRWILEMEFGTCTDKSGLKKIQTLPMIIHEKAICCRWMKMLLVTALSLEEL